MFFGHSLLRRAGLGQAKKIQKKFLHYDIRISLVFIIEHFSKRYTAYQRMRVFKNLIRECCFYKYNISSACNKSQNLSFIQTKRKDAKSRFNKIISHSFPQHKQKLILKKSRLAPLHSFINLVSLLALIRRHIFSEGISSALIVACHNLLYENCKVEVSESTKCILFYSEHELFARVLMEKLKNKSIQFSVFLHGFPYFPPDGKSFSASNYVYLFSYASVYYVWDDLSKARLSRIFDALTLSRPIPSIRITHYDPYNSESIDISRNTPGGRIIICLSNQRWYESNCNMIKIGQSIARKYKMQLLIRAHPSLTEKRLLSDYGVKISDTCTNISQNDIIVMYHSTLYFSLVSHNCDVFRYTDSSFDDFGIATNCFENKQDLERLISETRSSKA